jgi:hypothetical protein
VTAAASQGAEYEDRWITCTPDAIEVRAYYFPWGTRRIAYEEIRAMRRVNIGALTGKGRIWGTANLRYWASLDPGRPRKKTALILDLGRRVRPFLTPDDPDGFEAVVRAHAALAPGAADGARGPLI